MRELYSRRYNLHGSIPSLSFFNCYNKPNKTSVLREQIHKKGPATRFFIGMLGIIVSGQLQANSQTESSIAKVAKQIETVAAQLNNSKMLLKTERNELFKAESQISRIEDSISELDKNIKVEAQKAQKIETQIASIQQNTAKIKEQLRTLLVDQYKQGGDAYIKQLLNQENPYALGRLNNYRERFSAAMLLKLEEYSDLVAGLNQQQKLYNDQITILENKKKKVISEKQQLDSVKRSRQKNIVSLDAKLSSQENQLKKLTEDRARLQSLLTQIQQKATELTKLSPTPVQPLLPGGFAKQKGRLSPPVNAQVSTRFGQRIATSGLLSNGFMYRAPENTLVTAIYSGTVIFSDYLKGFGLLLIIDHGDNHISLYGHNNKLLKAVGDTVQTNEAVARVGSSGGQKQPGLYFEIRENTRPINPSNWLAH